MKTPFSISRFAILLMLLVASLLTNAEAATDLWMRYCWVWNYRDGRFSPGEVVEIGFYVRNMGEENSGSFRIDFYISRDRSLSLDDVHVGYTTFSDLKPTVIIESTASFTLPGVAEQTGYYIGAELSCENDSDSSNNIAFDDDHIVMELAPPDLAIQSIIPLNNSYRAGEQVVLTTTVENVGLRRSQSYSIDYTISAEGQSSLTESPLGTMARGALAAVTGDTFETTLPLPHSLADGYYTITGSLTCSDDGNASNDDASSPAFWVGPYADLAVQSVQVTRGTYSPHDEITVTGQVENVGDKMSESYALDFYASEDASITSEDQHIGHIERSRLTPGQRHSYQAVCQLPAYLPEGSCHIGVIASCANDGRWQNDSGCASSTITIAHPGDYLCGQAIYEDRYGFRHPIRYARVEVYEGHDEPGDPEIARIHTDHNGHFGAVVPCDVGQTRSIYVKVLTQGVAGAHPGTTSTIGDVKDDVLEEHYFYVSAPQELPGDASVVIDLTVPESHGAFMVYDSIVEGFVKAKTFLGIELEGITTYWPCASNNTFYVSGGSIHVAREDRGDRDVIMHEYGHYIAHVWAFAQGSVGEYPPQHYWNTDLRYTPWYHTDEQARNFAFREAWPTLFSIATQYGETWYPESGDEKYQDTVEWIGWTFTVDLEKDTGEHSSPGEFYENMVCCALWDIFDNHDDVEDTNDTLSDVGLEKIWAVTRDYQPESMRDFWDSWLGSLDHVDEITRIFADHGMTFPKGVSASSEDFETGDFGLFEWVDDSGVAWFVTAETCHQGLYSAQAGAVGDSQSTTLKVTLPCEAGAIRFWRKVSSEEGWDKLQFYIDGWMKAEWSGELDWEEVAFAVEAGDHTFRWVYMKSMMDSAGGDTAWIDDIDFPVASTSP